MTKGINVEHKLDEKLTLVEIIGEVSVADIGAVVDDVFAHKEHNVLVDCVKLDFIPNYEEFTELIQMVSGPLEVHKGKSALIKNSTGRHIDMHEGDYFELIAKHKGYLFRAFNTLDAAMAWFKS